MRDRALIRGAGGGGSGGGGEASDTIRSTQTADILDLISEGECEGLVNGLKSVYFDGVPLQAADGSFNFKNWNVLTTPGTQGQASIAGADGVQNEIGVAVDVVFATPVVRTITNAAIDTCRVTILVPQLSKLDSESGDLGGSAFEWSIEVQSNGGGYVEVMRETISGKTMSRYPRAKVFSLAGTAPWDIRVKRLSADSTSANDVNAFAWSTYAEIQTLRLRYPNSALVRTRVGAEQFARIPVRSFDWLGLRIQVPSNYDPKTRVYTGVWDGTFKIAWTDNPAWIYHDMVRNNRYGLGRYIPTTDAFKWELYAISRYCDGMVPDGYGGMEPRFRASPVLTTREQAYKVLTDLAAIFRGMAYWSNADVAVVQDAPGDSKMHYTPANVVPSAPGKYFTYSGTSNSKRYSSVVVWFNSLPDQGKLVPEIVVDRALEARIGVKPLELSPMGCWSRGQAQRLGKWALYTQQHEREAVVFKVGLDGVVTPPGSVFEIADPNEAGERLGGRVRAATALQVTLDADVTLASGESYTLSVMLLDPAAPAKLIRETRAVTNAPGVTAVLDVALAFSSAPAAQSVWLLQSDAVQATTWRCLGVAEGTDDNTFTITALEHAPQKFDLIELGIEFERPSISRIRVVPSAPTDLLITETPYLVGSSSRSRVTVSWKVAEPGLTYFATWRLNSGPWTAMTATSDNCVEVDGLTVGLVEVSVRARNALGNTSVALEGNAELLGKTAKPLDVEDFGFTITPGGVQFNWRPQPEDDYLTTTIKVGPFVQFEGAASEWTWRWPLQGTYEVSATHWDTSLNESAEPAVLEVVVNDAVQLQWGAIVGRPHLYRVVTSGYHVATTPGTPGIYNAETGALLYGAARSYTLIVISRATGLPVFVQYYDVFAAGADAGNPTGFPRGAAELAADLNGLGNDMIVVVYGFDEPAGNRLTGGLPEAMYRHGASRAVFGSPNFAGRAAYCLVGIGGCGEGNGFESYQGDASIVGGDPNAWIDLSFSVQSGQLMVTGAGATPRTLADYSYTGSLDATTDIRLVARGACILAGNSASKGVGTGIVAAWDSDVFSLESFVGGCYVSAVPMQANCDIMIGLNADPTTDQSFFSLDRALYMKGDGAVDIYENGAPVAGPFPYAAAQAVAVLYDGTSVKYIQNGAVIYSVAAPPGAKFFADSSFHTPGGALANIRFGPLGDVSAVLAAADAAANAAAAALAAASAANTQLASITNDNVLSGFEKSAVLLDWATIASEEAGIVANAANYGVDSSAYQAQVTALAAYLTAIPQDWSDTTRDSPIDGNTFRAMFRNVYDYRTALLNAISATAKARLGALAVLNGVDTNTIGLDAVTEEYIISDAIGTGPIRSGGST